MRFYFQFDSDVNHTEPPAEYPDNFRQLVLKLKDFIIGRFQPLMDEIEGEEQNLAACFILRLQTSEPYVNIGYGDYSPGLKQKMIDSLTDEDMAFITDHLTKDI